MVVVATLGSLASIAVPLYTSQIEKAMTTKAIAEISMLNKEIILYEVKTDYLPETLEDINKENLLDPWGNPYQYLNFEYELGGRGRGIAGIARKWHGDVPINEYYDLYSMGKDGETILPIVSGTGRDDIIMANDGQYIGLASEY